MIFVLELLLVDGIMFKWRVREGVIYDFIIRLSMDMQLTN